MQRNIWDDSIYTATRLGSDGVRHIISKRTAPPLCGATADRKSESPNDLWQGHLCQRCVQKYRRQELGLKPGEGWNNGT